MTSHQTPEVLDVVLPLGKPGLPTDAIPAELRRLYGRSLIEWAAEEAILAGATRILLVAPEGFTPAPAIARQLRQAVHAYLAAGTNRPRIRVALLVLPVTGTHGWDSMIEAVLPRCRGRWAMVIDPALALIAGSKIATFAAFMLRSAAQEGAHTPHLVVARTAWEDALSLPVLTTSPTKAQLCLDRNSGEAELTIFAGRALLPLPVTRASDGLVSAAWPSEAWFPFECFVARFLAEGASLARTPFNPVDVRTQALPDDGGTEGLPKLVLTAGMGVASLQVSTQ